MDAHTQAKLILGATDDYKKGLMSLSVLIDKVDGLSKVIGNAQFQEALLDHILALEEVYALNRTGEINFERHGRPVINAAVTGIADETGRFLDKQEGVTAGMSSC